MYIGFLTACLPGVSLEKKIAFAKDNGFKALELACWPRSNTRDYAAADLDVKNFTADDAAEVNKAFAEAGLKISSLAYYDNNLHHDPVQRAAINAHTYKVIDAAALLGVDMVGTFIGRNIDKSIADNMDEFEEVFTKIVGYAEERGIKIIIENCPMIGWQRAGEPGTISFTPELWDELFRRVPNSNFGLNFDPSHLFHMLIDYLPLVKQYKDRIFHVHAKDAEIFEDELHYYGVYNTQLRKEGWWRFRMPGSGQVDLKGMVQELEAIGYDGVVSIEHEDPLYEESEEKIYEGLLLGLEYLQDFVK
ncbi:MAG: sugar phosphate isomerase/epimerase [Clostridiaceae bacterium]|nr:sugar phosphate isomerase/epimerase [Clostridiaceae bacterium]